MAVRVTLAGRVAIEAAAGDVAVSDLGRLGRLALAYLTCERHRSVPRDELAEVLWGEDLPRSWEQMVRGVVFRLRRALEEAGLPPADALRSSVGGYQLRLPGDATVDIEEAAAAVATARSALERGETRLAAEDAASALAIAERQFVPGGSGAWVERRQADLRALHIQALEAVAAAALGSRDWAAATVAAEGAIGMEPYRESAYRMLIAAHAGTGNRGEALRAYERCRSTLAEELGVRPAAETEAAYLALLQDTQPEPPAAVPEPGPLPLPPSLATAPDTRLVEREAERDRLLAALERAAGGVRQAVFVGGEPGIGKTSLVTELARLAHAGGAQVLYGRCDEDLNVAFQPFAEAFGHYVAHGDVRLLAENVRVHGGELLRLVPSLAARVPDTPRPPTTDPDADRFRMFEALGALVQAASALAPVVLVIDDLHWAAVPTLLMLRHILRAAQGCAVLVVGTYRHTDVGPEHPLAALLADLRREPAVERIPLDGLSPTGVASLVRATSGEVAGAEGLSLAAAVHAHTAGNPFFVGELLRHVAETGAVYRREGQWSYYAEGGGLSVPAGVRDVVARRLGRLSAAANQALVWAAVVGAEFDVDLLERVVDPAGAASALDGVEEAIASGLVVEIGPGRCRFSHALVRDTIYAGLTATRRGRCHGVLGAAIEALPGDSGPRLRALAHHFAEAATTGSEAAAKAADYALAAARQAFAQAAWEDAIALLERALAATGNHDLERRCDLLLAVTEARVRLWDREAAGVTCLEAVRVAEELGSPERFARAARWCLQVGPYGQAAAALAEKALAGLGDTLPALRAIIMASLGAYSPGNPANDELTAGAVALARQSGDSEALGVALQSRVNALTDGSRAREHLAVAQELVEAAPPDGWDGWRGGLREQAIAQLVLGDRAGFDADAAAVARFGAQRRFWYYEWLGAMWRATQALLRSLWRGRGARRCRPRHRPAGFGP